MASHGHLNWIKIKPYNVFTEPFLLFEGPLIRVDLADLKKD